MERKQRIEYGDLQVCKQFLEKALRDDNFLCPEERPLIKFVQGRLNAILEEAVNMDRLEKEKLEKEKLGPKLTQ